MVRHIVLLGDSIFDNGSYVPGEPAVIEQLGDHLAAWSEPWRATLLARDGDGVDEIPGQLATVPVDATHLVLSAGGNDALDHVGLLDRPARSSRTVFEELARLQREFRMRYERMLAAALERDLALVVCTIYESDYDEPIKALADAALTVFNDAILRCAGAAGVPVIDLRRIFTARADYANPIEPSAIGGGKLVEVIARVCAGHDFTSRRATLYP